MINNPIAPYLGLPKPMHCKSILVAFALELSLGASPAQDNGPSYEGKFPIQPQNAPGIHGILEVDPDSGAARLLFHLGPGIGRPGLRYIPTLVGRFAPQVGSAPSAFELSPGSLDWPVVPNGPDEAPPGVRWTYPDGTGGCAEGSCPGDMNPYEIMARFGYAPSIGQGFPSPAPLALAGTAGERLLALAADSEVPVTTPPDLLEGEIRGKDRWAIPACLLVVRGDLAYEFRYAGPRRPGGSSGAAHYRLAAVRSPSGENVTFTYGPNGMDFQATRMDAWVRVALESAEGVVPVPALDTAFPALDSMAPSETFRDVEARLRIIYGGSLAETPGYTVSILLRAEDLAPGGATGSKAIPPAFRSPLQVARVQADGSGETVQFTYQDKRMTGGLKGGNPGVGGPGMRSGLEQLQALAAQATAQAQRALAEQEARRAAIQARMDAQVQAQIRQAQSRQQANLQAALASQQAARTAAEQKKQIEEVANRYEEALKQKEGSLYLQETELKRQVEELKRRSEELERKTKELERQAEELLKQAEALNHQQ